jgi:hypothetical protein
LEIFLCHSNLKIFFFPLKTFKEFVAQIGQSRVELWLYGTYLGGLRPPGGTLASATTIDLSQNSKQIFEGFNGEKNFFKFESHKKNFKASLNFSEKPTIERFTKSGFYTFNLEITILPNKVSHRRSQN